MITIEECRWCKWLVVSDVCCVCGVGTVMDRWSCTGSMVWLMGYEASGRYLAYLEVVFGGSGIVWWCRSVVVHFLLAVRSCRRRDASVAFLACRSSRYRLCGCGWVLMESTAEYSHILNMDVSDQVSVMVV
jgi:hypothetical protein